MLIKSYAKINFDLQILGKNDKGMHLLSSFAFPISLYDDIYLELNKSGKIRIECDNPEIPTNSDNICYKAVELLKERHPFVEGVNIKVIKRIPSMAGLGGGSSNAAAVLKGLNELLNLNLTRKELLELAAKLGSDVPFFIYNKPAMILGDGRRVKPLKWSGSPWILLVKPAGGVSTKEAYERFDKLAKKSVQYSIDYTNYKEAFEASRNDLEEGSEELCPSVAKLKEELRSRGLKCVRMSGSGSSVYALSESKKKLEAVQEEIKGHYPFIKIVHPVI